MLETVYFALSHSLWEECKQSWAVAVSWDAQSGSTTWEIFKFPGSEQLSWLFGEFIWFLTHFSGKQAVLILLALVGWLVSFAVFLSVCLLLFSFLLSFHMRCLDFLLGCKKKSALFHFHLYVQINYQFPRSKDNILYQCAIRKNTFGKHYKCRFYSSLFYTAVTWKWLCRYP